MYRPIFTVAVVALVLAGCGGGRGTHVLPSGRLGSDGGARATQSSNLTTFNGTLWYGDDRALYGVPLTAGAPSTEIDGSYAGLTHHQSRAMTIARDGTVYELIQSNTATVTWQLRIYAPGTHGTATPEETISGTGYPQQVALASDGIDVLWSTRQPGTGGTSTLSTYAYGTGSNPPPVRTLALGTNVTDAAIDANDQIYVARDAGGGVTVYPAGAKCACSPVRTIATGLVVERSIAVARDGTVYVLTADPKAQIAYVDAYAAGNNGSTPTRTTGPFYENSDVAPPWYPVNSPTGGITVDAAGDLYVGSADAAGHVSVTLFAPDGSYGRAIATPSFSTYLTSIAVGPATPSAGIVPTLYVASQSQVLAYPAGAAGYAAPQRTIGGFFYRATGAGPEAHHSSSLAAIATGADGTLDALYNVMVNLQDVDCHIARFSADASGANGLLGTPYCDGSFGTGAARGPDGEIDYLIRDYSFTMAVRRVVNGVPTGSFAVPSASSIAVGPTGIIYLAVENGNVIEYPAGSSTSSVAIPVGPPDSSVGAMCASPDGTLYVAGESNASGGAVTDYVYAVAPGAMAPSRTLGPFAQVVTALACDAQGDVYVGVSQRDQSGSKVKVFASNADLGTPALRVLQDPIPANDPAGRTIVSLAVSP